MPLLVAKATTKAFGGLIALSQVDFNVSEGEILGLIGPNGAGKTTLFNVITGVYPPTSGTIDFEGDEISCLKPDAICRRGISRTYQLIRTFEGLTVLENVLVGRFFGMRGHTSSDGESIDAVYGLLQFLEMEAKANQFVENLTMVDRKKVEIARALATKPKLLLLDEVMAGLNPTELEKMIDIIREINRRGTTLILIEHQMRAIMNLSQRILVLHHGEKIADGTPEEVTSDPTVIQSYLGE